MNTKFKKIIPYAVLLVAVPAVVFGGAILFRGKHYAWITLCVAVLAFIPIFCSFERRDSSAKELTVLAVMTALSAVGRFVFAWLPGFKPVTAITVTAAIYLGPSAGFTVGAMSAVISNFYFGQGPWTPFQMLAWGIIGFLAGALAKPLRESRIALYTFGALAGVLFSFLMDIWTVLWADGTFNLSRYAAALASAFPVTVEYAVSNVIFLLILAKPIGEKLERIKKKYGLFTAADIQN